MSESPRPNAKSQVIVLTLLHEGPTPSVVAERFRVSRRYVHYLLTRFNAGGLEALEPRSRRPKAYINRFEAVQPNETWQSDFTHWRLKDGRGAPIINWLDDHSRLLLHCTVHKAIIGKIVIDTFNECRNEYGTPFSALTDNGIVYTGRFVKGKNGFEYLLSEPEIVQKNGSPGHPESHKG